MLPRTSLSRALTLLTVLAVATLGLTAPVEGQVRVVGGEHVVAKVPARHPDPRTTRGLFVDPLMKAAQAGPEFARIGKRAQPLWITDFYHSPGAAKRATAAYVKRAAKAHKTPLITVYNIPDRDCGLYSSQDDQITDAYYRRWVTKLAAGIGGTKPLVILEPDAIPFIGNPACTGVGDRLGLLAYATKRLAKAGAWVYLDAGHSGWQAPEHMAPLLKKAGIRFARGFSTNVANTRAMVDEQAYAKGVVTQLRKVGVKGRHYVIDTGRNGAGRNGPANGDVCNPQTARLGAAPKLRFQGPYDGNLWVKNPGESDGDGPPCNGGPPSGEWWPDYARLLMS
jgi:endoglucanase